MKETNSHPDVDRYIAAFPDQTRILLEELRSFIRNAAPEALETISYQMPAYKLGGVLVYFAGYKGHIGLYPGASGIRHFRDELSGYKTSKGTVQFPLDHPIPKDLVTRIVKFKVAENMAKAEARKRKNSR